MTKKRAFTLVELIIVITIVAILSVTAFLVVTKWIGKSRDARRISDVGMIERAISISLVDTDNNVNWFTKEVGTSFVKKEFATGSTLTWQVIYVWDVDSAFMARSSEDGTSGGYALHIQKVITDPNNENQYYKVWARHGSTEFNVGASLEWEEWWNKSAVLRGTFMENTEISFNSWSTISNVALPSILLDLEAAALTGLSADDESALKGLFVTDWEKTTTEEEKNLPYTLN